MRRLAASLAVLVAATAAAGDDPLTLEAIFGEPGLGPREPALVRWMPSGSEILLRRPTEDDRTMLVVQDLAGTHRTVVGDWAGLLARLRADRPGWVKSAVPPVEQAAPHRLEPTIAPDGSAMVWPEADDLVRLDLVTGEAGFLTDGEGPELWPTYSPDGRRLAFVRDHSLWVLDLAAGGETRLTDHGGDDAVRDAVPDWVAEEELEVERSFWWSSDGRSILFLRYDTSPVGIFPVVGDVPLYPAVEGQRYAKAGTPNALARLAVIGLDGGEPVWIDGVTGDGYLPRAGWVPGGEKIWYLWLARDQRTLELRLADPSTGRTTAAVAKESDPVFLELGPDPLFVDSTRVVWTSRASGWRHLVLFDLDAGTRRQLTSGEWEVDRIDGLAGNEVLFRSTAVDHRERHLFSVGLSGGWPRRLDAVGGTHEAVVAPGGAHLLDAWSSLTTAPRLTLMRSDGTALAQLHDATPPELSRYRRSPLELGVLVAPDGTRLDTATVRPPDLEPGRRYPALLYVYGGPRSQLVTNEWMGTRGLFCELLAQEGLVVFWLDNRGTEGRGRDFAAAVAGELGSVEVADQLAGVRHLRSLDWVDPDRIAVYGGSYGGFMTLACLAEAPELFAAGIAYAPVTDWTLYDSAYTERYMGTPESNSEGYLKASVLERAARITDPVLLVHGAMDNNVHLQNTLRLVDLLAASGRSFELMVYPRVRHPVRTSRYRLHFHQLKLDFLERHLGFGGGGE